MNRILSCWIVDDEPLALGLLESYIQGMPDLLLTGKYNNPVLALQDLVNKKVDLIFLDIQMPHINGMELAYLVPAATKIIFITAFKEYALEGYRVNAFDYLLKPVSFEEFRTVCKKAQDWFDAVGTNDMMQKNTAETDAIFVKLGQQIIRILFKDIIYIEGLKDYVKIYIQEQSQPIIIHELMKNMGKLLPGQLFMRVHRSFIVQKNKIESINRSQLTIANRVIPIGRTYKPSVLLFINSK